MMMRVKSHAFISPAMSELIMGIKTIICPICNQERKSLVSHLRYHKLPISEFRLQYPDVPLISAASKLKMSKGKKGKPLGPLHGKPWQKRFWEKVIIIGATGCWEWQSAKSKDGYGLFRMPQEYTRMHYAHKVAYGLLRVPIPDGLEPDHLCSNPPCVNPNHLEPVRIELMY